MTISQITYNGSNCNLDTPIQRAAQVLIDGDDSKKQEKALKLLENEVKTATASMTSVPEPLKLLKPYFDDLKDVFSTEKLEKSLLLRLADILSVLATTFPESDNRECLFFKLQGNTSDLSSWGHEYVRRLCGEIAAEYYNLTVASNSQASISSLYEMVNIIVPFLVTHNAEAEAVDLLLEVNRLDLLHSDGLIDSSNYMRICLYLTRVADFTSELEEVNAILKTTYTIFFQQNALTDALRYVSYFFSIYSC